MMLGKSGLLAWLLALLPFAAADAGASLYKCTGEGTRVVYQDAPCPPGQELRDFDRDPANVSVVPFAGDPARRAALPSRRPVPGVRPEPAATKPGAGGSKTRSRRPATQGDARQRRFLRPGMSEGEVTARVGPPDLTARRNAKGSRWTYMPVTDDANTITTLVFENGKLADVERKVIR